MRKVALTRLISRGPLLKHRRFDPAHGFAFRNTGVGHAVEMAIEKLLLIFRSELAIVWNALVVIVRDQVKNIFLKLAPVVLMRWTLS